MIIIDLTEYIYKEIRTNNIKVYIISDGIYCKIGKTDDISKRLSGLQTGNVNELKIIATFPEWIFNESMIHNAFGEYIIRGEWFKLPNEIISELIKLSNCINPFYDLTEHLFRIGLSLKEIDYQFNKFQTESKLFYTPNDLGLYLGELLFSKAILSYTINNIFTTLRNFISERKDFKFQTK